jgi:hypothetical protein
MAPHPVIRLFLAAVIPSAVARRSRGDLIVLGGSAVVEGNSTVAGDIAIFGGTATIDGFVDGDVAVLGGSLNIGPNAVITGDFVSLGGSITRDNAAVIGGDYDLGPKQGWEPEFPGPGRIANLPDGGGFGNWLLDYFLGGLSAVAIAALLAALGILLLVLIPGPTDRVLDAVGDNTWISFGAGFLLAVISVPVMILLAITICLSPLAAVLSVLLVAALLYGWLVVGWLIGKQVLRLLKAKQSTPILEMVVGVGTLTLLWRLPAVIPCIGWLISFLVLFIAGSIGLGAVVLTRFGTRPYNGSSTNTNHYDAITAESTVSPATQTLTDEQDG